MTAGVDSPDERYPRYLPTSAILAMVFFELRTAEGSDIEAVNLLRTVDFGRMFYGAVVLRGDGIHPDDTAIIRRYQSAQATSELLPERGLLNGIAMTVSVEWNGANIGASLMWGDVNFSQFDFDLLALLKGTYRPGFASSFHGLEIWGDLSKA